MYTPLKLTDTHYPKIKELYLKSFGVSTSLTDISKKYATEKFGLKNLGFLAISENNEAAAYYGAFPIVMDYQGKSILVAQSGDTMTHPNHQKKGLFIMLAKETYKEAANLGVKLIYGFPNQNSYPGFKNKLNWVFTGNLRKFIIKNKTLPLNELATKFKFLESIYRAYLQRRFKGNWIEIENPLLQKFNVSANIGQVKHDKHFFTYKLQNPMVCALQVDGFLLFLKFSGHLMVGDVVPFEENKLDAFLKVIQKVGQISGSSKTVFQVTSNHWLYPLLKQKMEEQEGLPIGFLNFDESIDIHQIAFTFADIDTF
jgi:predicted N-acetyltransferase YhbS